MTAPGTQAPRSGTVTSTTVRPVMLLTLDLPLDARAQRFALETALGAGCTLMICDAVPVGPNSPATLRMRGRPDADASLRAAAGEARSLGVQVDELIFHSPRPSRRPRALCAERGVGLLVFGPSRAAAGRWRYRSWSRRVRRETPCLVWLPDDRLGGEALDQAGRRDGARPALQAAAPWPRAAAAAHRRPAGGRPRR